MKRQYATILSFNVKILPEALALSKEKGVKIIAKEVIYHLTDDFKEHVQACIYEERAEYGRGANFPVELR